MRSKDRSPYNISIHALREEGDGLFLYGQGQQR